MTAWFGLFGAAYARVMLVLAYWAVAALAYTCVRPLIDRSQIAAASVPLVNMVVPPALALATAVLLPIGAGLSERTYDYYLYVADASFGGQIGFGAGRLLARHDWLRQLSECAYINLPLAMATLYLLTRARSATRALRFVVVLTAIGAAGGICYWLFPGTGSMVIFGARFPFDPPALSDVARVQFPRLDEPRNAMPSLHAAWAFAIWWFCPPEKHIRTTVALYLVPMLLYTLACGHYFVDLVVALPFALSVERACSGDNGSPRTAALFALVTFLWLLLVRFGGAMLQLTPLLPWAATAGTLALCWRFRAGVGG